MVPGKGLVVVTDIRFREDGLLDGLSRVLLGPISAWWRRNPVSESPNCSVSFTIGVDQTKLYSYRRVSVGIDAPSTRKLAPAKSYSDCSISPRFAGQLSTGQFVANPASVSHAAKIPSRRPVTLNPELPLAVCH